MTHGGMSQYTGGAASWLNEPEGSSPTASAPGGAPSDGTGAATAGAGANAAGPTGWTAPLKPGLFPLRPLQFGEIFGASFRLLRTNAGVTVGSAILVYGLSSLLAGLATGLVAFAMFERAASASPVDRADMENTAAVVTLLTAVATSLLSGAGAALLQGVFAHVVRRAALAEKTSFGEAWRVAFRRAWPLLGYSALLGGASLVVVGVMFGLAMLPAFLTQGSDGGMIASILLFLVVELVVLAAALFIGIKLLFAPAAIMLEGLGPIAAMRRSWSLTNGHFWRILGITLLVQLIASTASGAVSTIIQLLLPLLVVIMLPFGGTSDEQLMMVMIVIIIVFFIALALQVVVTSLALVLIAGNAMVLYFDVRMRKEGLNIHLQRYREQLAAGEADVDDPFLAPAIDVPQLPPVQFAPAPPPGYAPPGYAAPGYAPGPMPPGYAAPGFAPAGYAPAGYAPAGYAPGPVPPGSAAPGFVPPGYAPAGTPQQGYAPTGSPQAGYAPPPGYAPQWYVAPGYAPAAAPQPGSSAPQPGSAPQSGSAREPDPRLAQPTAPPTPPTSERPDTDRPATDRPESDRSASDRPDAGKPDDA